MSDFLQNLLTQPEGKTLEFKQDGSSSKPFLKTLVAFANTAGGRLIFGVTDDRQIVGVEAPLDEEERLCSLIADSIAPRMVPNVEMVTVEGKTLLMVEVFLSGTCPHYLKADGMVAGVYVRLGSTNCQADAQLIAELQRGVAGISFDALPMPGLDLESLDLPAIRFDFAERIPDERMLQSLKILVQDQARLVPSQGGILLYGKERRFHFDDAWIQCGRFIGNDKGDIFDHIDIHDPLPKAVESIMLFLKKHAMRGADFSEIRRKDRWSIPINILREVVINALVHADYSHMGTPIRIAFYDNRIEVESPGLLLPGITVEEMKQGISQIRNPVIARVFRELDLIEQWGSGIPGIFREAKSNNLPEPTIEELAGRVRFTVFLPEILPLSREQSRKSESIQFGQVREQVEAQVKAQVEAQVGVQGAQVDEQVSEQVTVDLQILSVCQVAPKSSVDIAAALGHKQLSGNLRKALPRLRCAGLLEYTVPAKPNSRLQQYRLSAKGRALLTSADKESSSTP